MQMWLTSRSHVFGSGYRFYPSKGAKPCKYIVAACACCTSTVLGGTGRLFQIGVGQT